MSQPSVKPIPDGMHTVTPHLVCAGAADANLSPQEIQEAMTKTCS